MTMNSIGKFAMRQLVDEFDATLIRLYGMNMLDAEISRYEALGACTAFESPGKAAEVVGALRGFALQAVAV